MSRTGTSASPRQSILSRASQSNARNTVTATSTTPEPPGKESRLSTKRVSLTLDKNKEEAEDDKKLKESVWDGWRKEREEETRKSTRRGRGSMDKETIQMMVSRRCKKPEAIWCIFLTIIGFAALVVHTNTPRLKQWEDRTVTPAICVGSILAFGILYVGHILGWSAHKLLARVWSLIAFGCFGLALAGTLDGMEAQEDEPSRTPLLIKTAAMVTAALMHWGYFLMTMARSEKPLVQRQEHRSRKGRWREGILV